MTEIQTLKKIRNKIRAKKLKEKTIKEISATYAVEKRFLQDKSIKWWEM